ncbi:MAG TPA: sugar transferase [Flavitalea sp.]|nr:sugar transferase [Flavitalea sp.]
MVRTENTNTNKKVYVYRRITAAPEKKPQPQKLSYLYIGNRFKTALELHNGFEMSFFLFSFAEAFKLLGRLEKANRLPSVILVDKNFEIAEFQNFTAKLQESESFKRLPVMVEINQCSSELITLLSREKGITDLVRINDQTTLAQKAVFYNKLITEEAVAKNLLQQGLNWKVAIKHGLIRTFDLLFSSLCITLLSPLIATLTILVKLGGGNDVFEFNTERGLRYRNFRYIRFRTELSYAEEQIPDLCHINQYGFANQEQGNYQAKGNQTSRVGSFLRKTNLDELPALFNILIGDISFIRSR